MQRAIFFILTFALVVTPVFADWKLKQKTKMGGDEMGRTTTIYQKGVRTRREDKIDVGGDPEVASMMAQMGVNMPTLPTHISQCDLKQDLFLNEKKRTYFTDPYDWSTIPPEKLARRSNKKIVIKGTLTTDTVITDSGKRQQMFGLTARWLKVTQTIETSADSCDGASLSKMEQEGWFVTLSLESESCPMERPRSESGEPSGGCRPKTIVKRMANPGTMLTGTMRMYEGSKVAGSFEIETLELSKATLDQALFEIPKDFIEVDSQNELMKR
jgi:hypothetical protein